MKRANNTQNKLILILGPTASGKSDLAIKLALRLRSGRAKKKLNTQGGEIISADSRQVYKGLNIGAGKVTKKEMMGITHHLLDVANPKTKFSVAKYKILAEKAIKKIFSQGKIPIICGGSGFYIQAVIDGIVLPEIKPDWHLRKKLEKETVEQLFKKLKKLDPQRAKNIDSQNKRRLIRALEIVTKTKKPTPKIQINPLPYPILIIGIKKEKEELKKLIATRLKKRMKQGMVAETRKLKNQGLSWKRLEEFGLEYKWTTRFLQNKISKEEMIEKLQKDIEQFSRRQMTWFLAMDKPKKRIHWIKNYKEAEKLTREFLA